MFGHAATPGASLRLLEIADNTTSTFGPSVAVRQRFVCISHAPTAFEYYPADDPIRQNNNAICIDGLNNAGLSVAVLYQVRILSGQGPCISTASGILHSKASVAIQLVVSRWCSPIKPICAVPVAGEDNLHSCI